MKILFWGDIKHNIGPANINKGIVANLTDSFRIVDVQGKYRELLDAMWKLLHSDVVVVSGVGRKHCILVAAAKLLKKKSAYLMHGSYQHECEINGRVPDKNGIAQEKYLLKHVDMILPVSRRYMMWAQEVYPQYAHKMEYVYNGVDQNLFANPMICSKMPGSVAACGGMTPRKNLLPVMQAVELLEGKAKMRIFGGNQRGTYGQYKYSILEGGLPHDEFLNKMSENQLFVLNSVQESFSIATLEALACGCSLLVSEVAGVCDLLALEETDIIHDPMNVEEIRSKIDYLLDHPNYERLRSQFDPKQWSFAKMAENLEEKCRTLTRQS